MKKRILQLVLILVILAVVGAVVLNLNPGLENWLHQVTGWH